MNRGKLIVLAPFIPEYIHKMCLCFIKWEKNIFQNYFPVGNAAMW
jgi:hypothetical protein